MLDKFKKKSQEKNVKKPRNKLVQNCIDMVQMDGVRIIRYGTDNSARYEVYDNSDAVTPIFHIESEYDISKGAFDYILMFRNSMDTKFHSDGDYDGMDFSSLKDLYEETRSKYKELKIKSFDKEYLSALEYTEKARMTMMNRDLQK